MNSRLVVLNNESQEEYDAFFERCVREYQPRNDYEMALVTDIITSMWRLDRILALETATIDLEVDRQRERVDASNMPPSDEVTRTSLAISTLTDESRSLAWYSRHEGRLRRIIRHAHEKLEKIRDEKK